MKHYGSLGSLLEGDGERPVGVSRILNVVGGRVNLLAQRNAQTKVTTQQLPAEVRDSEIPNIGRHYMLLVLRSVQAHRADARRAPEYGQQPAQPPGGDIAA